MSSPMVVESVRTIPLVVEHSYTPMDLEDNENETGFPFDRDLDRSRRDDSFRSELDDLAKRHPEIAEHFEGFPFRSDAGSSGGGSTRSSRAANDPRFGRFTGRPFGSSRFERFGFPFTRDIFEDDFPRTEQQQREHEEQQQSHNQQPPQKQQEQQQEPPQQQHVPHNQKEEGEGVAGTSSKPPETPGRSRKPNIQQSNTVDLGQKQEPVNDRNQRSMSAPPSENRSGQQRFVSSIHIPVNREGGMGDMGGQQSQTQSPPPQPQQKQEVPSNKPMERVIPIHVEGRDEPVMPKHAGPSFSSHPQQPQQQYHQEKQQQHHPQSERIFGHMPSHFSQFVNREPQGRHFGAGPEWHHPAYERFATSPEEPMRQQQHQYQNQQQPKPHPQQPQQQQQQRKASPPPPPQSQKPQEEPPAPPQQPTPKPSTNPIDVIQLIQKDVSALMGQVEKFDGQPRDKQYLYLDEMLTRNLIKLDNIDTQGQENIRQARKEAIKCIEGCIGILEAKAAANVPQQPKGEANTTTEVAETKADEPVAPKAEQESMDIEPGEKPTMEAQLIEANVEQQPPAAKEATPAEQQEVKQSNETSTQPNENETNKSTEENAEQITEDKKEKKKGKQKKATKV